MCGRYEGFDERVIEAFADEIFSVGDFILTGGELPALMLCDSISRFIDGVLGNADSLREESFESHLLEAPQFAKISHNALYSAVPSVYLKGNHSRIADLKKRLAICKTKYFRPDLYQTYHNTSRREIRRDQTERKDYEKSLYTKL